MALTPIKAIRAKCMDCCAGQFVEVRNCPSEQCPLWEYRMGHRPGWKSKKEREEEALWASLEEDFPELRD